MSQIFDGIRDGLLKAKASQELQDSIRAQINEAINTADTTQTQPYRQISLAILKLLKPYDDKPYAENAESLITKIIETNTFVLQDFLNFEREVNSTIESIKEKLHLRPAWLLPARLAGGALGFIVGFVGISLIALPCAFLFNFTIGHWFFVFVAFPAGAWLAKDFYRGVLEVLEDSRLPKAQDKNPDDVAKLFLYKSIINLLRINYQAPVNLPSMKIAVTDAVATLVYYKPENVSEIVRHTIDCLKPIELKPKNTKGQDNENS